MFFQQVVAEGLGCFSYMIGCPGVGAMCVVDPRRDIGIYLDTARENGMKITHVIDTHVHADHVSGAHELRSVTGAEICMYESSPVSFDCRKLKEGDVLTFGVARMEVFHTPGHTPDALSLLVADTSRSEKPWILLTGDVLMVGDIGRPDLVGEAVLDEQIQNLWNTLYEKFGKLPDHIEVFPAHGAGSLCGRGMSSKPSSTLGFERTANPLLGYETFEPFHKAMSGEFPARPKSFTHIIKTNMEGAPLLACCPAEQALSVEAFEQLADQGAVVIDTRDASAYGGFHIPGSLNIGFEKQLANWVGMVVDPGSEILLVAETRKDYDAMTIELRRIGYDTVLGYLNGSINAWVYSGRPLETLPQISVHQLQERINSSTPPTVLDVRTPAERQQGHIKGAVHLQLTELLDKGADLPRAEPIVLYCGGGYRSNIAASSLKARGFSATLSLAGGFTAWQRAGLPIEQA
jgi:glyoxylase-like metal-dependent hydrolase (beta-lactamase superfamily II)/rhodanese-related sulfurtransferase